MRGIDCSDNRGMHFNEFFPPFLCSFARILPLFASFPAPQLGASIGRRIVHGRGVHAYLLLAYNFGRVFTYSPLKCSQASRQQSSRAEQLPLHKYYATCVRSTFCAIYFILLPTASFNFNFNCQLQLQYQLSFVFAGGAAN